MKKWITVFCFTALLATMAFAKPIKFTLINHTQHDITSIEFAAVDDDTWGDNIIEGDTLVEDDNLEISFDAEYEARIKKENLKLFDILCVIDGKEVEIHNLELAKLTSLDLSLDKKGQAVVKTK